MTLKKVVLRSSCLRCAASVSRFHASRRSNFPTVSPPSSASTNSTRSGSVRRAGLTTALRTPPLSPRPRSRKARTLSNTTRPPGKRTVLVSAEKLLATPGASPMKIDDYVWSDDNKQVLIFTNTKKVWRLNTRGDYWVLDMTGGRLKKLGGNAPESSLMFAKFSPDGRSVAFVRSNNIYVQDLATDEIRALTDDGSATLINGTTDWVTEEELSLRDAFRWSPDSQSIAYWQFDTTGVGQYSLINDTREEYPVGDNLSVSPAGNYKLRGERSALSRQRAVLTKWMMPTWRST